MFHPPPHLWIDRSQKLSQLFQPAIIKVAAIHVRLLHPAGRFPDSQSIESDQCDDLSFFLAQFLHAPPQDLVPLSCSDLIEPTLLSSAQFQMGKSRGWRRIIKISQGEVFAPVETAVIRVLQQPDFHAALARVVEISLPVDLDKNVLHEVFGLSAVPQNPCGNIEDKPIVAVEQGAQRLRTPLPNIIHQCVVARLLQADFLHTFCESMHPNSGSCVRFVCAKYSSSVAISRWKRRWVR